MSAEVWRVLPEFPMYEITQEGDIRNRDTHNLLKEVENPKTGAFYYCLRKRKKASTYCRNFWGLVYSAYPELLREWRPIPDFPNYLVNQQGDVMGTKHYKVIKQGPHGEHILRKNGKRYHWYFVELSPTEEEWDEFWKEAA